MEFTLVPVEQTRSICSAVGIHSIIIVAQNPEKHVLCICVQKRMKPKKKMPVWAPFKCKDSRLDWTDEFLQDTSISYLYVNVKLLCYV